MEFKLNVELKVPKGLMSNLAEVDKTKLEGYLQECLVEYLSAPKQETKKLEFETPKQETKEFRFDNISEMPVELEAELLSTEFMARGKSTQPMNFDNISEMPIDIEKLLDDTKALLNDVENEIIEEPTQPFKFEDIGAIANK